VTMLVLTGFMGVGKSTVGRMVAAQCGLPFVDIDAEIERRHEVALSQIFATHGEAGFRRVERAVLEEVLRGDDSVVATGGGALLSAENRALLGRRHRVICLSASVDTLRARLGDAGDRPVLAAGGTLETLLRERAAVYELFPQIDTTGKTPEQVADEVIAAAGLDAIGEIEMSRAMRTRVVLRRGGLAALPALLSAHRLDGPVVLVSDDRVADAGHVGTVRDALRAAGRHVVETVIPTGEEQKTLETIGRLFQTCVSAQPPLDRSAVVVALGGGVVCDLAGMLAATYLRGIHYGALPTTLLAQADAAIGGKVGVDVGGMKNLAGAFYPAELVLLDPDVLRTLPDGVLADGMAEIVKIGIVRSAALLRMLEAVASPREIIGHPDVIRQAAREKMAVVQRDPFERHERMMLNFGHTVGHAVETASDYRLSHGQSVAIGMVFETRMAVEDGHCPSGVLDLLCRLLERYELPRTVPPEVHLDPGEVMRVMHHDKKRASAGLRFALPKGIGSGDVVAVPVDRVLAAIENALEGRT
jgi:shikimate kinase / 3-dehydroquinate synthase